MANKVPMEFSPFVGPDSLRQFLYISKKLFENHTPRSYGFEDTKGSYYEGTAENWGAEELMESRKLLLDKPSLKNILIENTFDYYFDVTYSGFVNTYDQQNLLCALLRKDVLLSNHTYKLRFDDAVPFAVPRSKSSSDPEVVRDNFIMTLTPPTLVIDDTDEVTLKLTDISGADTTYFFHLDVETDDIVDTFVDSTLTTKDISDKMNGYPMIWMNVNVLNTMPDIKFTNNQYGESNAPILTIGTNGHNISYVYPFLSLDPEEFDAAKVLIKIIPTDNSSFTEDPEQYSLNFETEIKEIHLCFYDIEINIHQQPTTELVIGYLADDIRLTINGDRYLYWHFHTPNEHDHDYDYDGTTYINRTYAYINADVFVNNMITDEPVSQALLVLHMYAEHLYPTEYLSLNTYAGIHVDVTSDHSDNDVIKKNGIIHNMGDFDGLPIYFKYDDTLFDRGQIMNKKIHRAHVEMYALRDKQNDPYQKPMDKPTAAVIVESGIPQYEYDELTNDLPLTIIFDKFDPDKRHFYWDPDNPPVSKTNILSQINYIDMYHLGNAGIPSQQNRPKLIYHGNRHFSLKKSGFDPDLEYGRVYIISNDKCTYVNNGISGSKAPDTFARICDIPTHYAQLISNTNLAPTFILDTMYVRTEVNFDTGEIYRLWDQTDMEHMIHYGKRYVFDRFNEPDYHELANNQYPTWGQLINYVDLNDTSYVGFSFDGSHATGYEIGDEFNFYIGGMAIKGKIDNVDVLGVTAISFLSEVDGTYKSRPELSPENKMVNKCMFESTEVTYNTNAKTGVGSGLLVMITIVESYFMYLHKIKTGIIPGCFYFFKDDYNIINIYEYDDTFKLGGQVTGLQEYKNSYDTGRSRKYTLLDTFLYDNMNNKEYVMGDPVVDPWDFYSDNVYNSPCGLIRTITAPPDWGTGRFFYDAMGRMPIHFTNTGTEESPVWEPAYVQNAYYRSHGLGATYLDPTGMTDMSKWMIKENCNSQDTYYLLHSSPEPISSYAMITRFTCNTFVDDARYTDINYPDFGDLNLAQYYKKANSLKITFNEDSCDVAVYDPNASEKKTYEQLADNLYKVTNVKPITYLDVFVDSRFTPGNIIDSQGYLQMNVYRYNEYDTYVLDNARDTMSDKNHDELINIIRLMNPSAYPVLFENSSFTYSDDMLKDYIMTNVLRWGPEEATYTEATPSIYRKNDIKLFEYKGAHVIDQSGKPLRKQPTGAFVNLVEEIYPKRKVDNTRDVNINPEFIFRLDDVDPNTLGGFRLYDGDIDISLNAMLIINSERYIARIIDEGINWVKIQRRNDDESE